MKGTQALMKNGLNVGAVGSLIWTVDPAMVITLGGDSRATVFSTPNMILLMERAAREALREFLELGEESVGTDVNIEHLGGAPLGASVRGVAKVIAIEGRRIRFEVTAWAGDRLIGRGTHSRAIVMVSRVLENLANLSNEKELAMNLAANTGVLPTFETILVTVSNRIATVTLNRPRSLNAVNSQLTEELEQIVAWLMGDRKSVV